MPFAGGAVTFEVEGGALAVRGLPSTLSMVGPSGQKGSVT